MKELRIRNAQNGYIVEAPWPKGGNPAGLGEVVCPTLDDVADLVARTFLGIDEMPADAPQTERTETLREMIDRLKVGGVKPEMTDKEAVRTILAAIG